MIQYTRELERNLTRKSGWQCAFTLALPCTLCIGHSIGHVKTRADFQYQLQEGLIAQAVVTDNALSFYSYIRSLCTQYYYVTTM